MKKSKFIVACLLVIAFSVFALASTSESSDTQVADQGKDTVSVEQNNTSSSEQSKDNDSGSFVDNTDIGRYSVVIDSCRLGKTFDGKAAVIVKYIFTNVSNENATAFFTAFNETVYQGGVGLNEAWLLDDSSNYSTDNQTKKIKKGSSIDVEVAYELNDTTTDIEVEVEEFFSFDDKVLKKTFKIS